MPPKGKKSKKAEEEDPDDSELTQVDKQFYELTIADLNKKLSRLRTHNVKIEEKNEEMEIRMKQIEEDRQDVTAYLERTLKQKVNSIQELEDKLTELSKVRQEENENFKNRMQEWENKYKAMHDNLTSEIKLLTGKLNSMEEFRLQRDDLMAKFDTQEYELKEQAKKHKAILYEMERKVILDKERMRKDVENKLLELSTEFTKTSDSRVSASTQRILRENIALNNDMDRILVMQKRLKSESEEMKRKHQEVMLQYDANVAEKKRLMKTCEQQLSIIKKMTTENENSRDLNNYLMEIRRTHEVARKMTRENRDELNELKDKVASYEQHIRVIDHDRQHLKGETMYHQQEYERVADIIRDMRLTVKSALKGDRDHEHDQAFREAQRNTLLTDLLNILNNLEQHGEMRKPSIDTIQSIFYEQGDLGFLPKPEPPEFLPQELPKVIVDSRFLTPSIHSEQASDEAREVKSESINVIDIVSGTLSFASETEESLLDIQSDDAKITFTPKQVIEEFEEEEVEKVVEKFQTKQSLSIDLQLIESATEDEGQKDRDESVISGQEAETGTGDDEEQ